MTNTTPKPSKAKYWLYFAIATTAMCVMLVYTPQYFWIAIPNVLTHFAQAMDLM